MSRTPHHKPNLSPKLLEITQLLDTKLPSGSLEKDTVNKDILSRVVQVCARYETEESFISQFNQLFGQIRLHVQSQLMPQFSGESNKLFETFEIDDADAIFRPFNEFYDAFQKINFLPREADTFLPNLIARACLEPSVSGKAPAVLAFAISRPESKLTHSRLKCTPLVKALMKLNPNILIGNIDCGNSYYTSLFTLVCSGRYYEYICTALFEFFIKESLVSHNIIKTLCQSEDFLGGLAYGNRCRLYNYLVDRFELDKSLIFNNMDDHKERFFGEAAQIQPMEELEELEEQAPPVSVQTSDASQIPPINSHSTLEEHQFFDNSVSLFQVPQLTQPKRQRLFRNTPKVPETLAKLLETDKITLLDNSELTPEEEKTRKNVNRVCQQRFGSNDERLAKAIDQFQRKITNHVTTVFTKYFHSSKTIESISINVNGNEILKTFNLFYNVFQLLGFTSEEANKYVTNLIARACLHVENKRKAPALFAFIISRPESELVSSRLKYVPLVKVLMKLEPFIILEPVICDTHILVQSLSTHNTIEILNRSNSTPVLEFLCSGDTYEYVSVKLFQFFKKEKLLTEAVKNFLSQSNTFREALYEQYRHFLANYLHEKFGFPEISFDDDANCYDDELFFGDTLPNNYFDDIPDLGHSVLPSFQNN